MANSAILFILMFVPLLILLFVPFYLIHLRRKRGAATVKSAIGAKVLYGYVGILLIAMVICLVFVDPPIAKGKIDVQAMPNIYDLQMQGKLNTAETEKYIRVEKTFAYAGDHLKFPEGSAEIEAFVSKKGKKGKVELIYYETPTVVAEKYDITNQLPVPKMALKNNDMFIQMEDTSIELAGYKGAFPFRQFEKKKVNSLLDDDMFHNGSQFLYIIVPKNVKVEGIDDIE